MEDGDPDGDLGSDNSWVAGLVEHCHDGAPERLGSTGAKGLRACAVRRGILRPGSDWVRLTAKLTAWSNGLHLERLVGATPISVWVDSLDELRPYMAPECRTAKELTAMLEATVGPLPEGVSYDDYDFEDLCEAVLAQELTLCMPVPPYQPPSSPPGRADGSGEPVQVMLQEPSNLTGLLIHPTLGRYRTHFTHSPLGRTAIFPTPAQQDVIGQVFLEVIELNSSDRPSWDGLAEEPTRLCTGHVAVSWVSNPGLDIAEQEVDLVELVSPWMASKILLSTLMKTRTLTRDTPRSSVEEVFAFFYASQEKEDLFRCKLPLDFEVMSNWPTVAFREDFSSALDRNVNSPWRMRDLENHHQNPISVTKCRSVG